MHGHSNPCITLYVHGWRQYLYIFTQDESRAFSPKSLRNWCKYLATRCCFINNNQYMITTYFYANYWYLLSRQYKFHRISFAKLKSKLIVHYLICLQGIYVNRATSAQHTKSVILINILLASDVVQTKQLPATSFYKRIGIKKHVDQTTRSFIVVVKPQIRLVTNTADTGKHDWTESKTTDNVVIHNGQKSNSYKIIN